MTRDEALGILADGDFDRFVGVAEGLEVDFKGEPYRLGEEVEKFELAKDVSALANAAGGVIVVGVQTETDDESFLDVAHHLRLVRAGAVNPVQYTSIAAERVYPTMRGVDVRFCPSAADDAQGLVAIDVPPQQESDRYFLIQRPIRSESAKTWLVGLAIRSIGRVETHRIGEIHTLINRGLGVGRQLADVAEGLAELREVVVGGAAPPSETAADRLDALIQQRVDEVGDA
jgi:schlafen family protein